MVAVDLDQGLLDRLAADVSAAGGKALGLRADALARPPRTTPCAAPSTPSAGSTSVNAVGSTVIRGPPRRWTS